MSEKCIHELDLGQCSHCKLPPRGINKTVYVTSGGLAFHNRPDCETLSAGQAEADDKGMNIHPITPVGWGLAFASKRACRNCCPDYRHKQESTPDLYGLNVGVLGMLYSREKERAE